MLLTCVANFMVTLDALVVVTALPSIHRSLGGGITTLQWTLTAYTMGAAAAIGIRRTRAHAEAPQHLQHVPLAAAMASE